MMMAAVSSRGTLSRRQARLPTAWSRLLRTLRGKSCLATSFHSVCPGMPRAALFAGSLPDQPPGQTAAECPAGCSSLFAACLPNFLLCSLPCNPRCVQLPRRATAPVVRRSLRPDPGQVPKGEASAVTSIRGRAFQSRAWLRRCRGGSWRLGRVPQRQEFWHCLLPETRAHVCAWSSTKGLCRARLRVSPALHAPAPYPQPLTHTHTHTPREQALGVQTVQGVGIGVAQRGGHNPDANLQARGSPPRAFAHCS